MVGKGIRGHDDAERRIFRHRLVGQRSDDRRRVVHKPIRQIHGAAVGKDQGLDDQGAICIHRIEIGEQKLVGTAAADLNRQRSRRFVPCEGHIALRDARSKLNSVAFSKRRRVLNPIHAVAQVEDIGIVARSSGERVIPNTGLDRVIPAQAGDSIHHIRAGDRVVTGRARQVETAGHQLAVAQGRPIGESERVDRMSAKRVGRIEWIEMNRIAVRADTNQQRADA